MRATVRFYSAGESTKIFRGYSKDEINAKVQTFLATHPHLYLIDIVFG